MATCSKTVMLTTFKGIGNNYDRLRPQFAGTGVVFPYYRFGYNQKGNQENGYIILLFLEWIFLVRRSRSRSWSRSRYFQAGVGAGVA